MAEQSNELLVPGFDNDFDIASSYGLDVELLAVPDTDGMLQVILTGYVDTYNSVTFQKKMNKVIERGFIKLILDTKGLEYLSSTGIGALATILKDLRSKGGDFVLINTGPKILEVFKILGFLHFFVIRTNDQEAISYLKDVGGGGSTSGQEGSPASANNLFPCSFACPICDRNLKVQKPGKYRCSGCKSLLEMTRLAEVNIR